MTLKILISGSKGKVGSELVRAIGQADDMVLVGTVDRGESLKSTIDKNCPDIVIDFTTPEVAFDHASTIIQANVHPVIGTTGFSLAQIETLKAHCQKTGLGGVIAPNFSIGAVLMMRYARDAARYFEKAEIVELHHDTKKDAPSGTSAHTARQIEAVWHSHGNPNNVPIHSVRLPGLVAHQSVIFGELGGTLTLRHDSTSRAAFVPGVFLACRKVKQLTHLVYGMDSLLDG